MRNIPAMLIAFLSACNCGRFHFAATLFASG